MYQTYSEEVAAEELDYLIKKMVRDILWDDFRMAEVAKNETLLLKVKSDVVHSLRPERYGVKKLLSNVYELKELIKEILTSLRKRNRLPEVQYQHKLSSLNTDFKKTTLKTNNLEPQIDIGK